LSWRSNLICLKLKDCHARLRLARNDKLSLEKTLTMAEIQIRCYKAIRIMWYWICHWFCRVCCLLFFRFRSFGRENVPDKGGFLLVSNHQSYLDPVFCGVAMKRQLCYLARQSLFGNWFFSWLIYSLNAIPLKLDEADLAAVRKVIAELKAGRGVCIYPEGTRTSDGKIAPFKAGFGLLCRRGNAPLVPVVIDGAFECWPRHKKIFSAGQVTVCYGKVITVEQIKNMDNKKLAEVVTETLRQMQNDCRIRQGKKPYNY